MEPDDHVCLCFRVSLRKLRHYMNRERPRVPSQLSDCLGAGTGCQWCVPFLTRLHTQWQAGTTPDLPIAPEEYAHRRATYRRTGTRPPEDERPSRESPPPEESPEEERPSREPPESREGTRGRNRPDDNPRNEEFQDGRHLE